ATKLPASLRNNRDRIDLPITGLQQESGKIGALISAASASGRFALTPEQRSGLRTRLADVLWYTTLLCHEAQAFRCKRLRRMPLNTWRSGLNNSTKTRSKN